MINTMENTIKELSVTKSLQLLRDGFKNELATYVYADERMTELLMELVSDFVEVNIPVVDEHNRMELAMMMMESLDVIAR
jgi:RNase H-fold protein (predicted Holliday junction resolvase)